MLGKELGRLTELVRERAPDSVWQLLDWTARGDTVIVEWQNSRIAGGQRLDWCGVDKFRLRDRRMSRSASTWTPPRCGRPLKALLCVR